MAARAVLTAAQVASGAAPTGTLVVEFAAQSAAKKYAPLVAADPLAENDTF